MKKLTLLLVAAMLMQSHASIAQRSVSTITSSTYNKKTGLTTYSVLPFGSVDFPGKWRKTSYYDVSRQQSFVLGDSMKSAISINRASRYPFYKKDFSEQRIAREMYEWDSQYLVERAGGERIIVKDDTVNHFIIWTLASAGSQPEKFPMYLFGSERGIIYNLNIATDRWTVEAKARFLEEMYRSRKTGNCCQ